MKGKRVVLFVLGAFLCCMVFPAPVMAAVGDIWIADIDSSGNQGNMTGSGGVTISDDGRYVAFATNTPLVPADTDGLEDVYIRDMRSGVTTLVSVDSGGNPINGSVYQCCISGNGRYVAFVATVNGVVAGDNNGLEDVFVYDRSNGTVEWASVKNDGTQSNGSCVYPSISDDGQYVAFVSNATDIDAIASTGYYNVYIHETGGLTTLITKDTGGGEINDDCDRLAISGDGQYVAFVSEATDLTTDALALNRKNIFVCDRQGGGMELASISAGGNPGDDESLSPSISDDGRYVAFHSYANNLDGGLNITYDVFVRDRTANQTVNISVDAAGNGGNNHSCYPSLSDDGRYVAFSSDADNLVAVDTNGFRDEFVHDRSTGKTKLVSTKRDGTQGTSYVLQNDQNNCISGNGWYVAFISLAGNLVGGDNDAFYDLFVKQIGGASTSSSAGTGTDNDAKLIALGTSAGSLSPAFNPAVTGYSQSVGSGVKSVTVTAIAADPRDPTNICINGVLVASGTASDPIPLNAGSNTITVEINGRRGSTTYTITVTRGEQNPKTGDYPAYWLWIAIAGGALLLSTTTLYLRSRAKNRA